MLLSRVSGCPICSRAELRGQGLEQVNSHGPGRSGSREARCSHLVLETQSPKGTHGWKVMEINPSETKLWEEKLNTGEEAPQNREEELVLSSWEVNHAPYAPPPLPRVTDHLLAVLRRQARKLYPSHKETEAQGRGLS